MVENAGAGGRITIDSAGTGNWHVGMPPDQRAQNALMHRGRDVSNTRARQIELRDFVVFDLILAMDQDNFIKLKALSPIDQQKKIHIFRRFANSFESNDIPDPYYGTSDDFEVVLDMIESASLGLLDHCLSRL